MAVKRGASGAGTTRKKTVTRSGKKYTYWEGRVTIGHDPGTGKQIQKSFTGQTQKEVLEKIQAATVDVASGVFIDPSKLTVGEWLDIWTRDYLGDRKLTTINVYKSHINANIKPALGSVKLSKLNPATVQAFVNGLTGLSPASVRLAYKVLNMALETAVDMEQIPRNPAKNCTLPRATQKEIVPLSDAQTTAFLAAAKGCDMEQLFIVALFSGLRMSEILGLTWDAVNFRSGKLTVSKQLARPENQGVSLFTSPKNGKTRVIHPASIVFDALKAQKRRQAEMQLKAGPVWDNPHKLVFTNPCGDPLLHDIVRRRFHKLAKQAGAPEARFHDLRHTYAVNSIRAGDDPKTVSGNLGHATVAFTLDRYGHFTEQMKQDSAARMNSFITSVLGL